MLVYRRRLHPASGDGTYGKFRLYRSAEDHSISEITARREVHPVRVDTRIEDLVLVAADQNFVPVIDDKNAFIGIVTRSSILKYCLDRYFSREYELVGAR